MKYLFGFPYYVYTIDPKSYDKEQISKDILNNYYINPVRNKWDNNADAYFTITNYTAMKTGQYMRKHNHIGDCDFTCVHYFKFNPKEHPSTTFYNPNNGATSIRYLRPNHYNKLDITNPEHSYRLPYFQLPAKEDEIHIMPSEVEHEVPPFNSDELRVTIVVNLSIK